MSLIFKKTPHQTQPSGWWELNSLRKAVTTATNGFLWTRGSRRVKWAAENGDIVKTQTKQRDTKLNFHATETGIRM